MRLLVPQALLLLVPLGFFLWRAGRVRGLTMVLRALLVTACVLALAQPELVWRSAGSDLVVVVDRSRSMPPGSDARADEVLRLLEGQRRPQDRLGVVTFGRQPRVEVALSEKASFGGFSHPVDGEASDLAAALDLAGELVPVGRSARVLVLSDGRANGVEPRAAARRLAARGLAIDFRHLGRDEAALDLAVVSLDVPAAVSVREPFLLSARVKATAAAKASVTLRRGGQVLARAERELRAGENVLQFRDLLEEPGFAAYEVRVDAEGDGVVENDLGRAVLRVEGPPRVLLLSSQPKGALAQALVSSGMTVEARAPFPLSMGALEGVGAVVLENVEAGELTEPGLQVLNQFVAEAGGGLVMTGGRKSFGEGGYRKSPVEELLPVSLEVRQEQRKAALAMAVIMDCSCSMGVTVPDGRTKMELAAEGVVAALTLLNENDEASVHMVDTQANEIFGMSPVRDGLPLGKVARGFSGGGGIYVGVGLRTARDQILRSDKPTRHVLLFSDAADSEEPADYQKTLAELGAERVSVSVIGLGTRKDSDARLLEEIARLGGGRVYFAEDATSLPRIFSQETIAVARATFVESTVALKPGPDLPQLGRVPSGSPSVGGYNLTYLKPRASVAFRSSDENDSPVLAFWPHAAGKVVAYTGEVDGTYTGPARNWSGFRPLLEQSVRWTMPARLDLPDAVARSTRMGSDLHVTVDFDARSGPPEGKATVVMLSGDGRAPAVELPMRWEDDDRLGAHFSLPGSGVYHPVVKLGGRVVRAPPVTLPYAPEFEPGSSSGGKELLGALARLSGGVERLSVADLFRATQESLAAVALGPALAWAALLLLLAEVVTRRLGWGARSRLARAAAGPSRAAEAAVPAHAAAAKAPALPEDSAKASPPSTGASAAPAGEGGAAPTGEGGTARSALEVAQERARRRLRR